MTFIVALTLSVAPGALMLLALVVRERRRLRRLRPRQQPLEVYATEAGRARARLESEECRARNRDLAMWNCQFRPSDGARVFRVRETRSSFRERVYLHADPLTDENVVKCGLMKRVVLPS